MSSNNDTNGAAMGLGLIIVALAFVAFAVYAIACFIAGIFTVLSLLALKRPLKLWGAHKVDPAEARIFLISGIVGAIAVPLFAEFCAFLADAAVPPEWGFYLVTGGYAFISLGVLAYLEENEPQVLHPDSFGPVIDHVAGSSLPSIPQPQAPQTLPRPQFEYASWDDESEDSRPAKPECQGCWLSTVPRSNPDAPVFRR